MIELVRRRGEALETLRHRTWAKRELVSELDVSRSTVNRAISELTGAGLVCRVAGGYRTTALGASLLDAYRQFRTDANRATSGAAANVSATAPATLVPPPSVLAVADTVAAAESPAAADRAVGDEPVRCRMEGVDRLRAMVETFDSAAQFQVCHDLVVERDAPVTLLVNETELRRLRDTHRERLRRLAGHDACRVLVGETPDACLRIADRGDGRLAVLTMRTPDGDPVGVIESDHDTALWWARETFDDYAAAATDVTDAVHDPARSFEDSVVG